MMQVQRLPTGREGHSNHLRSLRQQQRPSTTSGIAGTDTANSNHRLLLYDRLVDDAEGWAVSYPSCREGQLRLDR